MKIAVSVLLILLVACTAAAQDKELFFLNNVPQSAQINPSIIPRYTHYMGVPFFSDFSFNVSSSSFSAADILTKTGGSYTFDNQQYNYILSNLKTQNFILASTKFSLVDAGFKRKDIYWSVNFSVKSFSNFFVPKSVGDLQYGIYNPTNNSINSIALKGLSINSLSYYELALGGAKAINNNFRVGARIKLLSGIAAVNTKSISVQIIPNSDLRFVNVVSDINLRMSFNNVKYQLNSDNKIARIKMNGSPITVPFTRNIGLAVDLGTEVRSGEKLTFFGSLTDLGFITWSNSTQGLTNKSTTKIEDEIFISPTGSINSGDVINTIADSLQNKFTVQSKSSNFVTSLFTKAFFGTTYQLNDWLDAGLLLKGTVFKKIIDPSITVALTAIPSKNFRGTATWSYWNSSLRNLGLGVTVGDYPTQVYFIVDNVFFKTLKIKNMPTTLNMLIPQNARSVGIQFGINIFWGERTFKLPWRWRSFESQDYRR